ncbi:ATP-binding cassette domain-containing protein [Nostoc sp. FACHB-280]|uniref:ABC transporter ATP-binding protein n=1 Tax=Nostoc sp. FACHB-280 TaxID=2692839 RepID=UPI00168BD24E|nr:ATP-binding cassette domain-containing protein [Nostoc sp. FACHB-280]MBD2495250.1 ATP-binding cassette domain-containing protein [Nostoc sp. FACHB-280]
MTAVELENLRKTFTLTQGWARNRRQTEIVAVDDITLSVPDGQAIAFIGPNGAGKSTTIKMLTGILYPTSGQATLLGLNPWKKRRELAYQIGVVFGQRSQLWYHLPPRDTLELLARIYNLDHKEYIKRRDVLVERFDLKPFWHTPVRKLSLGQRMRAEVAASLLHKPRLLFLDEPTIGLDVIARQELRDLIREWNRTEGITVFLTSHDAGDIERVAQRVVVINHGKVVLDDKISAMRRDYLGSKILSVRFHDAAPQIILPGVTELKKTEYALKLEVNTRITPIEAVMSHILQAGSVADIAIEDPPLEEVIAHIYSQTAPSPKTQTR